MKLIGYAMVAGLAVAAITSARAQFFDDRYPFERRGWGGGGFGPQPPFARPERPPADYSHAPQPRKYEKSDGADLSTVLVLGDSMADWLAFGLETAFSDAPELSVMRKHRTNSSLIYSPGFRARNFDWVANAKEVLAKENAQYIVMMIGLGDRESIREPRQPAATTAPGQSAAPGQRNAATPTQQRGRNPATPAQPGAAATPPAAPGAEQPKPEAEAAKPPVDGAPEDQATEETVIATPEPTRSGSGTYEFKSERWVELYTKRVDETIAALKAEGVPVFWVGLPPIRGTRSTSDVVFLNDLYKARAEKAGITYIDVWDGFVDEGGRFMQQGPDFEGQTRRLRAADGVHFTQAGARKLAHYVEKEIRRAMTPSGPIAIPLPVEPEANKVAAPDKDNSMPRPLAGPVLPLNAAGDFGTDSDELAGSSGAKQALTDALATRILVQGDQLPVPAGRADDFAWPRRGPAPLDGDPVVAKTTLPMTPMLAERAGATKTAAAATAQQRPRPQRSAAAQQAQRDARRPQQQPSSSFFFFFQRSQ